MLCISYVSFEQLVFILLNTSKIQETLMNDELLGQRRIYAHGQVVLYEVSTFQINTYSGRVS